jgi:hypothetical protein
MSLRPGYKYRFIPAIVTAMQAMGGNGSTASVIEHVIRHCQVSERDLLKRTPSGEPTIRKQILRCKQFLLQGKFLQAPTRGWWQLTEMGWAFDGSDAAVTQLRRDVDAYYQARHPKRAKPRRTPKPPVEGMETIDLADTHEEILMTDNPIVPALLTVDASARALNGVSIARWSQTREVITPALAMHYLERNVNNRSLRPKDVDAITRDMVAGNWRDKVGGAICFDVDGNLRDGQHRLWGVVKSGVSLEFTVIRGLTEEDIIALDSGRARNFSDVMRMQQRKSSPQLASAVTYLLDYEHRYRPLLKSQRTHTKQEKDAFLLAHPELEASIYYGRKCQRSLGLWASVGSGLHYLIHQEAGDHADDFFETLADGTGIESLRDPIGRLRSVVSTRTRAKKRVHPLEFTGLVIKAWNAYAAGHTLGSLTWRDDESLPEIAPWRGRGRPY